MNREIKFRVWDIDRKEWVKNTGNPYVFPFHGKTAMTCAGNRTGHIPDEDFSEEYTIEQFTGLKDSEGVEIYEGDWVEFTYWWFDGNHRETTLSGEVVYLPELMSYALKGVKNREWCQHVGGEDCIEDTSAFAFWRFENDDFHVRGNIHQHPELFK